MGHSGVGKTTLIRLILGYLRPLEGTIVLQDAQTQRPCSPGTRGLISYVPQGNTLFSGTIAENLRLGLPRRHTGRDVGRAAHGLRRYLCRGAARRS